MIVRRSEEGDTDALRALWYWTWHETYGPRLGDQADAVIAAGLLGEAFRSMFAEDGVCLVAIEDGTVSGSICFAERGGITYLWGMYVRPDRQRRGIGTALMRQAIAMLATSHRIELTAVDSAAVAFYRSLGFEEDGWHEITLFPDVTAPGMRLVLKLDTPALTPATSAEP